MNILLVDDDRATRESLGLFLRETGHDVTVAENGMDGADKFDEGVFHLVVTDVKMPKLDGFGLLRHIKATKRSYVDVIIITGHGDINSAITALREGAYDYLQKPVNIDELSVIIERVSEHLSLKQKNDELTNRFEENVRERVSETEDQLDRFRDFFRETLGLNVSVHSHSLADVFALAEKFHRTSSVPVLIEGETGTGKEVLARYVHHGPEMSAKPFVAINCAAIPTDLFESELFGHEAGAFTGASTTSKKGQIEMASDGTLLLDEIGDMPLATQVKLLRVIEEREFYRVGGVKRMPFKARIIASTNKSLKRQIEEKKFRDDLYHRLNVGFIKIPPLRERREEIIPLAYDFISKASARFGKKNVKGMTRNAEQFIEYQPWPGNVRQLENAIERVVLLFDGDYVDADQFAFLTDDSADEHDATPENRIDLGAGHFCTLPPDGIDLDDLVTRLVEEAMRMSNNNKTMAAKLLNISPRTISRRLDKKDEYE